MDLEAILIVNSSHLQKTLNPFDVHLHLLLTLFRIGRGGGKKALHTSFSLVTSEKVGISPQNFLNFSLNPFNTLVGNFKVIPSASPKLLNLNEDHPSKKERFFWSNPYKIEVMKTSLIEMLQLPNFGNMPTSTT